MWNITHHSRIPITSFFEDVLGVKLNNHQWSWGARDLNSNRVYLKLWDGEIHKDKVAVYWKDYDTKSQGRNERLEHLDAVREGDECFGVVCEMKYDPRSGTRRIRRFDDVNLLLLGSLIETRKRTWARIFRRIPVSDLGINTYRKTPNKAKSTWRTTTSRQTLAKARSGQGEFGSMVRALWNHRCAVTGSITPAALEASHIRPWADSNNQQRLDPSNGLLLTATLHKLFDAGLITFENSGKMLVSSRISQSEINLLGLNGAKLAIRPSAETVCYLAFHRKRFLK